MTITELRAKFIEGSYTPVDALNDYLKVIAEKGANIHAYLEVFEDAREAAEAATERYAKEGDAAPALCGMPMAFKNNILIKGKTTTAGSKMLEQYKATYNATVVEKLKAEGVVFVGATNLDEFAMGSGTENSAFGVTKNPHDTNRVPGGSSGGSAAAVAMGGAVAALGTDTGGSIRQPASFCGLVGFKPTYGAVSRYGLVAMGSSLDQAGPLAQTVTDAELIHTKIAGLDPMDSTTIASDTYPVVEVKETYTIGVPRDFLGEGIDPDVMEVFEAKIAELTAAGHTVIDIELPLFEQGLAAYYIVMPAEVSSNLARFDGMRYGLRVEGADLLEDYMNSRAEGFGPEVQRRILLGTYVLSSGYYDAYYGKAEQVRTLMRAELAEVFKTVDAVMLPTAPTPAFKIGEHSDPVSAYKQDIFTVPVNLTGVPAISIPSGTVARFSEEQQASLNLPVGVQYIAPHGGDARLFDLGKKINQEL